MPKVRIKASTEDFEKAAQDQGDFVVPPNGYYILQLKECNPGLSKDDDGNEDPKRPRLECIWEIVGIGVDDKPVDANYGNVWDYVSFSKESGWHRGQFLKAVGLTDGTAEFDDEVDTDELIGVKIIGRLRQQRGRTKDDEARAKLRAMLPYEDGDNASAFGEATATDGDSADEAGDEEDVDYTEEELGQADLKELGRIAKEDFELEPNDFIVKVRGKLSEAKTKAKLIQAILDAQAEDAGDEDGDGANPF